MKRFYKQAVATAADDGFAVHLDGKPLRTPAKAPLVVPSRALGEAIAAEWQGQGSEVAPGTLPLTRLASTAIDLVVPRRAAVVADIANYAGTDLVCYRADHPPELVARQHQAWQPLVDWAALRYDAPLGVTSGILPLAQPPASLRALTAAVEVFDAMGLTALNLATGACGSLVVALALLDGRLDAEAAFAVSQLDETYEIEQWGEDSEQMRRRAALKDDIALAARFFALLNK